MPEFKSGFVSIIGKTNVGKSTLLNALIGEKVAITTSKSQTTRTAIKAILNNDNSQIIFVDTPGLHKPKNKLGNIMLETIWNASAGVDIILFLIDATSKKISKGDRIILEKLKNENKKAILVINKIDLIKKEELFSLIELYKDEYNFKSIVPISAENKQNINELILEIENNINVGPAYYNIDEYTDQTERTLVEEVIREKALKLLDEEIPHGIYIEVEKMSLRNTSKGEEIYDIDAIIYCLRNSHKGIIIGKNGTMLKKIASYARQDLEKMLDIKINLKVWVKVKENWQDNNSIIKKFELK